MDARAYLEMKAVGFELDGKRQVAAEARQANLAQQRSTHLAGTARLAARGKQQRSYVRLTQKVVAALLAALLAAALVGQAIAPQSGVAARGSRAQKQLVVRERGASEHQPARGSRAPNKQLMVRGRSTSFAHQLIVSRAVAHKHAMI